MDVDLQQQKSNDSESDVDTFMEITGSKSREEARDFLEESAGDLGRAINIYFMRGQRSKRTTNDSNDVLVVNGKASAIKNKKKEIPAEGDDEVRAPIAPTRGVLVPQSFRETYQQQQNGLRSRQINPVFEQFHERQQHIGASSSSSSSNEQAPFPAGPLRRARHHFEFAVEGTSSSSKQAVKNNHSSSDIQMLAPEIDIGETTDSRGHHQQQKTGPGEKPKRDLAALFRPPVDLTFQGDWEDALEEGKRLKRWLLVNIQNAGEFASQILNRDIWSLQAVREVVRGSFLLWQVYHDSPNGVRISGYYSVKEFPAIFIIDPRTGEEVFKLRAPDHVSFLDQLTTFLDQYPDFETRDRLISKELSVNVENVNLVVSPESQITYKRKYGSLSVDSIENEEEKKEAEQQAKRMRRVVTISDDDIVVSAGSSQSQSPTTLNHIDPNEWLHYLAQTPPKKSHQPCSSTSTVMPTEYTLILRLPPDGQRREAINLWGNPRLRVIFSFLTSLGVDMNSHILVANFPKRTFSLQDSELTLEQAGFTQREVLHVEKD